MKEKIERNQGITLIALIITIVILIILTAVTINNVMNSNLFNLAKGAAENYVQAGKEEQEEINEIIGMTKIEQGLSPISPEIVTDGTKGAIDDSYTSIISVTITAQTKDTNVSKIRYKITGKQQSEEKDLDLQPNQETGIISTTFNIENYGTSTITAYTLDEEGKILGQESKTVSRRSDYVDYPVDIDGTEGNNDWKIFYKDNTNGRIFIISDDYIPNTCEALLQATESAGLVNCSDNLSRYCWRWTTVPEYKTVSDEVENLFWLKECKISKDKDLNNSKCVSALLDTNIWKGFLDEENSTGLGQYAVGGPTIEMLCNSWNNAHSYSNIYVETNDDFTGYNILGTGKFLEDYVFLPDRVSTHDYSLWYPRQGNTFEDNMYCSGYWVASPSMKSNDHLLLVGCGGDWRDAPCTTRVDLNLRPVICLNSNVSVTYDDEKNVFHLEKLK